VERILVTGAAGFLGRHLIATLVAAGAPTVALCREPSALRDLAHPALEVAAADVRDGDACARWLAGVDTVFHLAAVRNRPGSRAAEMAAVNETATLRLARQAVAAGARRFVAVGSAQAWGPSPVPLDESAPLATGGAASCYAASRARGMTVLRDLAREGAPVVTIAPTIVYGPDHPSSPNRVTSHLRHLLRRRFDVVVGSGEARRDLVHVGDVVTALRAAAREPAAVGEELLVTGEGVSQRDLARLVAACAGRRPPLVLTLPLPVARPAARLLDRARGFEPRGGWASSIETLAQPWSFDGAKARRLLGHRPRALAQGIAETVAWIRGAAE
jgi:nucleoside-diphosphate-sugar epimerase